MIFPETRPASEFHETWSPTENFVDMLKLLIVIPGFAYITVRRSPWRGIREGTISVKGTDWEGNQHFLRKRDHPQHGRPTPVGQNRPGHAPASHPLNGTYSGARGTPRNRFRYAPY